MKFIVALILNLFVVSCFGQTLAEIETWRISNELDVFYQKAAKISFKNKNNSFQLKYKLYDDLINERDFYIEIRKKLKLKMVYHEYNCNCFYDMTKVSKCKIVLWKYENSPNFIFDFKKCESFVCWGDFLKLISSVFLFQYGENFINQNF